MNEILALEDSAEKLKDEGKLQEAVAEYKKILEQDENFVRAHLALAVLYDKIADPQNLVLHAEKACELEPNDHFNALALSISYQKAFEHTQDMTFIQKAEFAKEKAASLRGG